VLEHWETASFDAWRKPVENAGPDPRQQFSDLGKMWLDESEYSPAYDAAVRDWARVSPAAEAALRRVDNARIELIHGIFLRAGYTEPEAIVRARIAYFHQVGYYTLNIVEDPTTRLQLKPYYFASLGIPLPDDEIAALS
jgi:hypothetical protein